MTIQKYSVTQHPIENLLTWVKSGEIAIPEIQRPFVWDATKVRNLLDSLYSGYPVGYLIVWRNPTVRLKDGSTSSGKRILIDGQQRVTALWASLLGREVLTKAYKTTRIRIAFHPIQERFEVLNPAIQKDPAWISDLSEIFSPSASIIELTDKYTERNPGVERNQLSRILEGVKKIINNHVGVIELEEELDIETVTEIFIRVNSAGASLSQADFAMSKIAANEIYGGNLLRKAIDYFCHSAQSPEFLSKIEKRDFDFANSEFLPKMRWLKDVNDDLYDPTYTDMLRVAFTSEFRRGKLQDLVALLSGRNFETKKHEEEIVMNSFSRLKKGIMDFMNETHFERFTMILRSAGFITSNLIRSKNAIDFAYIIYLCGRAEGMRPEELESLARRWYVMSVLRGRYSSTPETAFDSDIRQIDSKGLVNYINSIIEVEMSSNYFESQLPQEMETASRNSPFFLVYQAAQTKLGDKGFLSKDITVRDLLLNGSDVHHIYPKAHLMKLGLSRGKYNQIANFVIAQSEINIGIGGKDPEIYFNEISGQCNGGLKKYGGIEDLEVMKDNLTTNSLPPSLLSNQVPTYEEFLEQRRGLMAQKIKTYFETL